MEDTEDKHWVPGCKLAGTESTPALIGIRLYFFSVEIWRCQAAGSVFFFKHLFLHEMRWDIQQEVVLPLAHSGCSVYVWLSPPPHNLLMLGLFKMNGKLISVFSSSCSKNSFYLKIKIKNKIHIHKKTVKRVKVVITSTSWFIAGVGFVPKSKKTVQLFFV